MCLIFVTVFQTRRAEMIGLRMLALTWSRKTAVVMPMPDIDDVAIIG